MNSLSQEYRRFLLEKKKAEHAILLIKLKEKNEPSTMAALRQEIVIAHSKILAIEIKELEDAA